VINTHYENLKTYIKRCDYSLTGINLLQSGIQTTECDRLDRGPVANR